MENVAPFSVFRSRTRSSGLARFIEDIEHEVEAVSSQPLAEIHTLLALNQSQFKDDVRARGQDAAAMGPDEFQQPVFKIEVPRHEIACRTVRAEEPHEPLIQCHVNAPDAWRQCRREGRLTRAGGAFDDVDYWHDAPSMLALTLMIELRGVRTRV